MTTNGDSTRQWPPEIPSQAAWSIASSPATGQGTEPEAQRVRDETYPVPGLLLTASPLRRVAFSIIAVPLILIVLVLIQPWNAFQNGASAAYPGTSQPNDNPFTQETGQPATGFGPTDSPTTEQPTGSSSGEDSPSPTSTGPDTVVVAYFNAINQGAYQTAWNLGGDNLNSSYPGFVSGFSTTQSDTVSVQSVSGDQVVINLEAKQTDGTDKTYSGTYTVVNGVITSAQLQQTN